MSIYRLLGRYPIISEQAYNIINSKNLISFPLDHRIVRGFHVTVLAAPLHRSRHAVAGVKVRIGNVRRQRQPEVGLRLAFEVSDDVDASVTGADEFRHRRVLPRRTGAHFNHLPHNSPSRTDK